VQRRRGHHGAAQSSFTLVSTQTQKTLAAMLSDVGFADAYIHTNRERLRARHDHIVHR
jgi:1-aminocyclopropane-1-carboxylate synthase